MRACSRNKHSRFSVSASAVFAVAAAAALDRKNGKRPSSEEGGILLYGDRLGPMDRDAHLIQSRERACADAADNDRIYTLVVERLHRVARAVRVMLVPVMDRCDSIGV